MATTLRVCIGVYLAVAFLITPMMAQEDSGEAVAPIVKSALLENVTAGGKSRGEIDWGERYIYATGIGAISPKIANRVVAKLKATDYAKGEAVANLLMVLEGTSISYDGTGRDYMSDVTLRQKIEGYVKNVEMVSIETYKEGEGLLVKVTVRKAMFGTETPGTAFLENIAQKQAADPRLRTKNPPLIEIPVEKLPSERAAYLKADAGWKTWWDKTASTARAAGIPASSRPVDPNEAYIPPPQTGPFTSLIVDTRGYDVLRAMGPKIRQQAGEPIWGNVPVDDDTVLENGVAAYVKDMEAAKKCDRCGANPLVIVAVGRAGGKAMCDTVVSEEDAKLILDENTKTKFLDKFNVIFVTNPGKPKGE